VDKMNTQSQLKFSLTSGLGRWMVAAGLSVAFLSNAFAEADPNLWPVMKEAFFAKREMKEVDFIKIDAPKRAESGAQVPVTYSIDNAAASGVKIVKLYSFRCKSNSIDCHL